MKQNDFEIVDGVLVKYHGNEKKVIIPDTVKAVGNSAFYGMTFIEEIIIPNSVKVIGARSMSCMGKKFAKVVIPESVDSIDFLAFDCDELVEVYILNPKISIFPDAFDHCFELSDIYFKGTEKEWDEVINPDEDCPKLFIDHDFVTIHYNYQ